jgi:hypothetical protein
VIFHPSGDKNPPTDRFAGGLVCKHWLAILIARLVEEDRALFPPKKPNALAMIKYTRIPRKK